MEEFVGRQKKLEQVQSLCRKNGPQTRPISHLVVQMDQIFGLWVFDFWNPVETQPVQSQVVSTFGFPPRYGLSAQLETTWCMG